MKKNKDDQLCGGAGNCREGSLDDPPTDDEEPKVKKVRLTTNRRALKNDPNLVIRLGLPAEE